MNARLNLKNLKSKELKSLPVFEPLKSSSCSNLAYFILRVLINNFCNLELAPAKKDFRSNRAAPFSSTQEKAKIDYLNQSD
jgi:hypothetical protein